MASYDPDSDLRYEFRAWQKKHPNFITPRIVSLHTVPEQGVVIEVSSGRGMDNEDFYGVTPWVRTKEFKFEQAGMEELRSLFDNKNEALRFSKGVQKWFKEHPAKRPESPLPEMERAARFARRPEVPVRRHVRRAR